METLYDIWCKRSPQWESKYQEPIMNVLTDYGKGVNKYSDVRGKIFGAGYEIYIIAFFIGLYYNQTKPLVTDAAKKKDFGWPILNWGSIDARIGRNQYTRIREYMFAALIARTDIDLIALDKGEITAKKVVDDLIKKMEEYANYGLDYIQEKLEDDPNYFFKETAFIRIFLSFLDINNDKKDISDEDDDEPDSLD
jgi:hypothetical protein